MFGKVDGVHSNGLGAKTEDPTTLITDLKDLVRPTTSRQRGFSHLSKRGNAI